MTNRQKRRFPAPWRVEAIAGGFCLIDVNGVRICYVYGDNDTREHERMNVEDARRIANAIAKLPEVLKPDR